MSGTEATGAENAGASGVVGTVTPAADAGAAAQPSAPASAPDSDPFGDLPADQAVFDRGYVDQLRREGARYRTEARGAQDQLTVYDETFSPYEQADRDVWLDLARQWVDDPKGAAAVMQQIASAVLGEGTEQRTDKPAEQPTAGSSAGKSSGPLTQEDVAEYVRQEMQAAQHQARQEQMVESIYTSMRTAGIEPKSSEGMAVLWLANNDTAGDIDKAIEMHKATRQKAIDEYVAGRATGRHPTPAPSNGVAASAHTPISNLDDARKAADAYLRERGNA